MTILTACQSAAIRLVGRKPTQFFSATDTFELELTDLAQEAAVDIAKQTDWQALTVFKEQAGDATLTSFDLPTDFDRLTMDGDIHAIAWENGRYTQAESLAQWRDVQDTLTIGSPGFWIILENKLNVFPAMPADEKARYYYISKNVAKANDGTLKAAFTADNDSFRLDERLLTLALMWRWRQMKRLDYAEDLENYERALMMAVGRQKGGRQILAMGGARFRGVAPFPGQIIP